MTATNIFADLTNRQLVASSKSAAEKRIDQPSRPGQYDTLYLAIQPMLLTGEGTLDDPYELIDAANYSVTMLLVKQSDGSTLSGPVSSWTVDETRKVGKLNLNTAAMATAMSGQTSVACYIEFLFDDGTNAKTTIRQDLTVQKAYITAGTPTEYPLASYLTREECVELFVRWANNENGKTIELKSGDGTKTRVLGVDNDSAPTDES